jgi:hypothetical protein
VSAELIARAAVVPMFAQPSLRSEQVSQLVLGETATVLERDGAWCRARAALDCYDGWVHTGYVVEANAQSAERWLREATGWSGGAVVRASEEVVRLPLRARVALEENAVRLPDGRRGRVQQGRVTAMDEAIDEARARPPERWALDAFAGTPYAWGGVTPAGVDCSGLVQTTFLARGVALPRDAAQQADCGAPVAIDAWRPGDLLFFRGDETDRITHVAFAAEGDTLIHSTVACGGVLQEPWRPGTRAASLRPRLVAVRRLEER